MLLIRGLGKGNSVTWTKNTVIQKVCCLTHRRTMANWRPFVELARKSHYTVDVEEDGTRAVITIPGMSLDDFDRTGNWNIGKLQSTLTRARFLAYHTPHKDTGRSFLEYDVMTSDRYTFMASCRTEVTRKFRFLPDKPIFPTLAVSVELGHVGMSSLSSVSKLYDPSTQEVYATNINQVVSVDKSTRRPTPLPDWWKDKYKSYSVSDQRLVIPMLEAPEQVNHSCRVRASWNDVDRYKHVNYVAYIRYCLDAAMDAVVQGKLEKIHNDILEYQVKRMDIAYKKECNGGDWLLVSLWQNPQNSHLIHFDITLDSSTIFQNSIEFYSSAVE